MNNEFRLIEGILALSVADDFETAKKEWLLQKVYKGDTSCLCGHIPINNICVLVNKHNGNTTIVGSTCVKKFIGLPADKIFASLSYITKNNQSYLGKEAIEYLYENKMINDWEFDFLKDTVGKSYLSPKQMAKRVEINNRLIENANKKE